MKPAFAVAALIAAVPVVAATSAAASSALGDIMHAWKSSARSIRDELSGRVAYNEKSVRAELETYVDDAGRIAARVNPRNAEARDFRARFAAFQADAQTALRDAGRRPSLAADYSRLMDDCQSCHDLYKD